MLLSEYDEASKLMCRVFGADGACRLERHGALSSLIAGMGLTREGVWFADEHHIVHWRFGAGQVEWSEPHHCAAVGFEGSRVAWADADAITIRGADGSVRQLRPSLDEALEQAMRGSRAEDRLTRWVGVDHFAWEGCPDKLVGAELVADGLEWRPPKRLAFSPDGRFLAAATRGVAWTFALATDELTVLAALGDTAVYLDWSRDGTALLAQGGGRAVLLPVEP